nr:VTT domain-containing protein [Brevibacterium daeguense]
MLWIAFNVRLPTIDKIQGWVSSLGWASWGGFAALYAVVALTPIPVTIMAVAGGLIFGVVVGSVLSVVGVLIGCWGAYWIARLLGKTTVLRLLGSHGPRVEAHLQGSGFQAVCTLRLLPGIPYWPINYGSGAFGVSQRDFLLASAVATVPGQVSLVAIGSFVGEPTAVRAVVVAVSWIVVIAMTVMAYRSWRRSRQTPPPSG